MRAFIALLLAGGCWLSFSLAKAQGPAQSQQPDAPRYRAEDGGVSERMESIVVSAKAHAPFTLTLETEWARPLSDGGSITIVNKRRIARDAEGRVYQERWFLVPKGGDIESKRNVIQIEDPNAHTLYNCFFFGPQKNVCELRNYSPSAPMVNTTEKDTSGDLPDNQGSFAHQFLGKQMVSGVETIGVRESTTYNPGVFGNDRRMTVEREEWYSPQLDLNVLSVRSDPRTGKQTFTATNVILGDPDPSLFELPTGFTTADHRRPATGELGNRQN
jgi:hypothetical protein